MNAAIITANARLPQRNIRKPNSISLDAATKIARLFHSEKLSFSTKLSFFLLIIPPQILNVATTCRNSSAKPKSCCAASCTLTALLETVCVMDATS